MLSKSSFHFLLQFVVEVLGECHHKSELCV